MSIEEWYGNLVLGFSLTINFINLIASGLFFHVLRSSPKIYYKQLDFSLALSNTSLNCFCSVFILIKLFLRIGYGTEQAINFVWYCPAFTALKSFFVTFSQFTIAVLAYTRYKQLKGEEHSTKKTVILTCATGSFLSFFYASYYIGVQFEPDITGNFCAQLRENGRIVVHIIVSCIYAITKIGSWILSSLYLHSCTKLDKRHPHYATKFIYTSNAIIYFIVYSTPFVLTIVGNIPNNENFRTSLHFALISIFSSLLELSTPLFILFIYKELRVCLLRLVRRKKYPVSSQDDGHLPLSNLHENDSDWQLQ